MAATTTATFQGSILGGDNGDKTIGPVSYSNTTGCPYVQYIVLQAGANTITPPTAPAPTGCLIKLPSSNTSVVTLKGASGDTGIAIGKTTGTVLHWDKTAVPASFVLSSVSTQTGLYTEIHYF